MASISSLDGSISHTRERSIRNEIRRVGPVPDIHFVVDRPDAVEASSICHTYLDAITLEPSAPEPASLAREVIKFWMVDDEDVYRDVLVAALKLEGGLQCTGSFADAESALEDCARCNEKGEFPRVVLLDVGLPGMLGTSAIRKLKEFHKGMKVVMLSVREDDVVRAILEEADGYLYKPTTTVGDVARAILEVDQGACPFDPYLLTGVLKLIKAKFGVLVRHDVSRAETRVLELLARGEEVKSVAEQLNLSIHTVASHVKSIRRKYDVHSIRELLVQLRREGPF